MYGIKEILSVVGIFVIWIALCLGATAGMFLWDKYRMSEGYDERQMMHRGRGTVLGFWAMILFHIVVMIWNVFDPDLWGAQQVAFLGILIGGMVSVTYFMITDSWMKVNERHWWVGPAFILSGVGQLMNFNSFNESLLLLVEMGEEAGPRTEHFQLLLIGLGMIYYGLLHMICRWWHNRE